MNTWAAANENWPSRPWVGVNFWSRAGGPRMWSRYDRAVVRQELAVLAAHGCTVTRSFCYWPDFVPRPEVLDEDVMERFADFLDLHADAGLRTVPTFIVGHMSGQNWDPEWRSGRDLYRDVWLVGQQAWFVAEVARRVSGHPADNPRGQKQLRPSAPRDDNPAVIGHTPSVPDRPRSSPTAVPLHHRRTRRSQTPTTPGQTPRHASTK